MSREIDEKKVLQFEFDYEQFEEGAQTILKTLDKLDEALKFEKSSKGAHNLKNTFDSLERSFDKITISIEKTANKYSWFEQIAIGAYRKIGESTTKYLANSFNEVTGISSAKSGWAKYESEVEGVQKIMNATGKSMKDVEPELKKLAWYTDETSYHYDAMIDNIGKFNAAGITDLKQATNAMMGIANMAGYFGINATSATHAMNGFAKAMGAGKMDNNSWDWIKTAGMNAAGIQKSFIETGVEMGKLKKTAKGLYQVVGNKKAVFAAEQFTESFKYKWLDTNVMMGTFGKYSKSIDDIYKKYVELGEGAVATSDILKEYGSSFDEMSTKAFKGAQETKTFTDALGALKEATASQWRESFRYIFGNYEEARDMWSAAIEGVWDTFTAAGGKRNDLLKGWYEGEGRDKLIEGIANLWEGIQNVISPVKEAFDFIFPGTTVERLLEITDKFKDMTGAFKSLFDVSEPVKEEVKEVIDAVETLADKEKRTRENLGKLVEEVWAGKWGRGEKRRKALEEANYVWQIVQNAVNESSGSKVRHKLPVEAVADAQGKLNEQVAKGKNDIKENSEAYEEAMAKYKDAVKRTEMLKTTFEGLFSVFDIGKSLIKGTLEIVGSGIVGAIKGFAPSLDTILGATSRFGQWLIDTRNTLKDTKWFKNLADKTGPAMEKWVKAVLKKIEDIRKRLFNKIEPVWTKLKKWFEKKWKSGDFLNGITGFFSNIWGTIKNAYDWIAPKIESGASAMFDGAIKIWDNLSKSNVFDKLGESLKTLFEKLGMGIGVVGETASGAADKGSSWLKEKLSDFFGLAKDTTWSDVISKAIEWVIGKIDDLIGAISSAIDWVGSFFQSFGDKEAENISKAGASIGDAALNLDKITENTWIQKLISYLGELGGAFVKVAGILESPFNSALKVFDAFTDSVAKFFEKVDPNNLGENIKQGGIGAIFLVLAKKISEGSMGIASIPSNVNSILIAIKDTLRAYTKQIQSKALMDIAKALAILTLSIVGLSMIDSDKLADATANASVLMIAASMFGKGMAFLITAMDNWRKTSSEKKLKKDLTKNMEDLAKGLTDSAKQVSGGIKTFGEIVMAPFSNFLDNLSKSINKKLNGGSFAKSLLLISLAIALITAVAYQLYKSDIDFSLTNKRLVSIGIMLGGMLVLMGIVNLIANFPKNKQTIGGALSFITMAMAVAMIIDIAKDLAMMEGEAAKALPLILGLTAVLGLLIVAIGAALNLASSFYSTSYKKSKIKDANFFKKEGTKSGAGALFLGIIGFAIALKMMAPSLKDIGSMKEAEFNRAIGIMFMVGLVMLELAGIAKIFSKTEGIDTGLKSVNKIIIALGLLAILMTHFHKMTAVDEAANEGFARAIFAFAIALAALGASAFAFVKLGLDKPVEKLAKALDGFGIGLLFVAGAAWLFAQAGPKLVETIALIAEKMSDPNFGAKFTMIMGGIILAIVGGIVAHKLEIGKKLVELFTKSFGFLKENWSKIIEPVMGLLKKVTEWLAKPKTKWIIGSALIVLIIAAFSILDGVVPTLVERIVGTLLNIAFTLSAVILDRGSEIFTAMLSIGAALGGIIVEGLAGVLDVALTNIPILKDIAQNLGYDPNDPFSAKARADNEELANAMRKKAEEAREKTNKNTGKATYETEETSGNPSRSRKRNDTGKSVDIKNGVTEARNIAQDAIDSEEPLDFGALFDKLPDSVKQNIEDKVPPNLREGFSSVSAMLKSDSVSSDWKSAILGLFGIQVDVAKETGDEAVETTKTTGDKIVTETKNTGDEVLFTLAETSKKGTEIMEEAGEQQTDAYIESFEELDSETKTSADQAANGFYGVAVTKEILKKMERAGKLQAGAYLKGLNGRAGLYEQSPSKKTRQSGLYAAMGLINGTLALSGMVYGAGSTLGSSVLAGISNSISTISSMFAADVDMTPVITPVIDLDNVQSGIGVMNGLLNSKSVSLAASAKTQFGINKAFNDAQQAEMMASLNAVGAIPGNANAGNYYFETPVILNGREIARGTAEYTREELNRLDRINSRKGGRL